MRHVARIDIFDASLQRAKNGFGNLLRCQFGRRHQLIPFIIDGAGKHIDDADIGRRHLGAQALRQRVSRRLGCREGAVRREVAQRIDGQQIDPGGGTAHAISAAGAHGRAELLGQAQQPEVVDIHLGARGFNAVARRNAFAAMKLGVVDQDVDLATNRTGAVFHLARIGHIKRQHRDLGQLFQFVHARKAFPRLGVTDPDDLGTCVDQAAHDRLTGCGFAIGHQCAPKFRIAGELSKLRIVRHVCRLLYGKCHQYALPGPIEPGRYPHRCRCVRTIAVQVRHHGGAGVQPHHAEPPGQTLAKEKIIAVPQNGFRNQLAGAILIAPLQPLGQAAMAGLARRVLHRLAVFTDLQLKAPQRGGGREAQRYTAATARRLRGLAGFKNRVLAARSGHRLGHVDSLVAVAGAAASGAAGA